MRLGFEINEALQNGCKFWKLTNGSEKNVRPDVLRSECPKYFQAQRIAYLADLLGLREIQLYPYNRTSELLQDLIIGKLDLTFDSHYMRNFFQMQTGSAVSFVAPFAQDKICLFRPMPRGISYQSRTKPEFS